MVGILIYYVNHYLPKGPMIATGDVVCQNDGRGSCGESSVEDVRNLKIPEWAKFFKKSDGMLLFFGLLFGAIVVSAKREES
ncbi:MAG: hypothetical protein UY16_C0004G0013 [Candidatus Gottesmanbacteria bacterium GW2011_GWA2_47_9]|nr:MAG: hypothetical protein UY16_C0004G0013 [Candidatus Gottesmanbacteria bacterium GW2011_GWA2_47_9]KKU96142.1 MAG: hypothetical protein UY27_C0003G0005 [Candidatus Gottesmanbacteria bacterium GW2011_GWA1_48_13]